MRRLSRRIAERTVVRHIRDPIVTHDGAVLRRPTDVVLTGVALYAGSSYPGEISVYAEVFVQPLYVPRDHLDLSHARRVGGSWTAPVDMAAENGLPDLDTALARDGISDVHGIVTPAELSRWLRRRDGFQENAITMEAAAFSDVLCGATEQALKTIEAFDRFLEPHMPAHRPGRWNSSNGSTESASWPSTHQTRLEPCCGRGPSKRGASSRTTCGWTCRPRRGSELPILGRASRASVLIYGAFWLAMCWALWRARQLWHHDLPGHENRPIEWKRTMPFLLTAGWVCVTFGGILVFLQPSSDAINWPALALACVFLGAVAGTWRISRRLWHTGRPLILVPPRLRDTHVRDPRGIAAADSALSPRDGLDGTE